MTLLLQLHGDLPEYFPGHERKLYVFSCRRKTCRRKEGSVRAIRSIRSHRSAPSAPASAPTLEGHNVPPQQNSRDSKVYHNIGNNIFGSKSTAQNVPLRNPFSPPFDTSVNPFSTTSAANPFAGTAKDPSDLKTDVTNTPEILISNDLPTTFAQKARISSPSEPAGSPALAEPWPAEAELPLAYPTYFLDADYETLDIQTPPATLTPNMDIYGTSGTSSAATTTKEDSEAFESTIDKTFQRFADRLAQNSLQVLRYDFRGSPLLYSKRDAVGTRLAPHQSSAQATDAKISVANRPGSSGMPPCANCGSARVFEFQLTPQAICELEVDETGLEGMEWGTVIVGVCNEDCEARGVEVGQVGYQEEWVGVQWEENRGPTK